MGKSDMPLTGRDRELTVLRDIVERAVRGHGGSAVVLGEPGIGKSRLLRATAADAKAAGAHVVRARFLPGEEDLPLAALRRGLSVFPEHSRARAQIEALFGARTLQDIRPRLVRSAIEALMDLVAAHRSVVFLVEDVHWADNESLQVLRAVLDRLPGQPVAVLVTARPLPRPRGVAQLLDQHMAADGDHRTMLSLRQLDDVVVAQLAAAVLDGSPDDLLRRQLARTGGNPLLLEEMFTEIRRRDAVRVHDGVAVLDPSVPLLSQDLDAHVADRMAALAPLARQVVTLVALSDLSPRELAALLDTTVAGLSDAIEAAVVDGLVVESDRWLRLRHDLLRETVIRRLPATVVSGLRADLLRLFTDRGVDLDRVVPQLMGADPTRPSADGKGLAEAGRDLLGSAPYIAAILLRRALAAGVDTAATDLAFALILLGRIAEASGVIADLQGRVDLPEPERARAGLASAQLEFLRGDLRAASVAFETVAPDLDDPSQRALALADAAVSSVLAGQLDRAETLSQRTCVPSPRPHERAAAGTALMVRGWAAALRGDLRHATALAEAGHALSVSAPGGEGMANQPDFLLGQVLAWADRPAEAAAVIQHGIQRIADLGMHWVGPLLHAVRGDLDLRLGRWAEAATGIETALAVAADLEVEHGVPWCLVVRARMGIARAEDVSDLLVRAEATVGRLGGQGADLVLWMRGLNHLSTGRHGDAATVLGFLWGRLEAAGMTLRQIQIAGDLMRAAVVADAERAASVLMWLETTCQQRPWPRAQAALAHARGLHTRSPLLLAQAAVALEDLDDPVEAARVFADAAAAGGVPVVDNSDVAERADRAMALLERVGAQGWLPRTAAPSEDLRDTTDDEWATLTPSQARTVYLVGQGLSNAEIARQLSVSRRTVESHLYNAYAKLGLSTRVTLSLAAARRTDDGWHPDV